MGMSSSVEQHRKRIGRPSDTTRRYVLLLAEFEKEILRVLEPFNLRRVDPPAVEPGDVKVLKVGLRKLYGDTVDRTERDQYEV